MFVLPLGGWNVVVVVVVRREGDETRSCTTTLRAAFSLSLSLSSSLIDDDDDDNPSRDSEHGERGEEPMTTRVPTRLLVGVEKTEDHQFYGEHVDSRYPSIFSNWLIIIHSH